MFILRKEFTPEMQKEIVVMMRAYLLGKNRTHTGWELVRWDGPQPIIRENAFERLYWSEAKLISLYRQACRRAVSRDGNRNK